MVDEQLGQMAAGSSAGIRTCGCEKEEGCWWACQHQEKHGCARRGLLFVARHSLRWRRWRAARALLKTCSYAATMERLGIDARLSCSWSNI